MARTLDQLVREALGAQTLEILQLTAQLEAAREQIAASAPSAPLPPLSETPDNDPGVSH